LLGRMMPLSYYWFILFNGACYAVVGLAIEIARRSLTTHTFGTRVP